MDAIEQAVRNAFAKGNPEDPAFRERVYRSAQNALEKAIAANPTISPEAVARRRQKLLEVVAAIESEFVQASEPVAAPEVVAAPQPSAPTVRVDPPRAAAPAAPSPRIEPDAPAAPRRDERRDPDFATAPSAEASSPRIEPLAGSPRQAAPVERAGKKRSFPWGFLAGLFILLVVAGLAFWTVVELGLLKTSGNGRSSEPSPASQSGTSEQTGSASQPGGISSTRLEDWMPVFEPSNPTTAVASDGARVEVLGSAGAQVMRVVSGPSGAPVSLEIGQGVLERLAGKRAIFDIVAKGGDSKETQISVTCTLQGLDACGRNRYAVGVERGEYLFEVDVPANAASGTGSIEIVSDISAKGGAVDLLEVRVSVADPATN